MNIDWSKAPHGVMGYHPEKTGYAAHWVRWEPNGDNWLCVLGLEFDGWVKANSRMGEKYLAEIVNVPAAWNGEGLPPVGTVCEWFERNCSRWAKCEVVFSSSWVMVIRDTSTHPDGPVDTAIDLVATAPDFRPIRTPEQIAADKHKAEIDAMVDVMSRYSFGSGAHSYAEALHKAGYRKQVAP